jgi:hypothetical protein
VFSLAGGLALRMRAQSTPRSRSASPRGVNSIREITPDNLTPKNFVCPGGFPTDLTNHDCRFTKQMRVSQWITTSFTDEAMLQSVASATFFGQTIPSPSEWGRTWNNYGLRIGANYTGATARGTTEFLIGALIKDDPRHISYKDDPRTHYGTKLVGCSTNNIEQVAYETAGGSLVLHRIGHAFLDSVTVRHSNLCGNGTVLPAMDRLGGIWAAAYASSGWYPAKENTLPNVAQRAAISYGVTLGGSFYNEFSAEITSALMAMFGHRNGGTK